MIRTAGRLVLCLLGACAGGSPPASPSPPGDGGALAARVSRLADDYIHAYFQRNPESATRNGIAGAAHGSVIDNSPAGLSAWRAREDALLDTVRRIDPRPLVGRPEWAVYGVLREVLEDSVAVRICRMELWNLSTANSGWLASYAALAGIQPVGTDTLRSQAVARVRRLARYLDVEVENLRAGLSQDLTAPRVIIQGVLRQLDEVLATPPDSSPFAAPIRRDTSRAFREAFGEALQRNLIPALQRYRRHLAKEYLPRARASLGVSALPEGEACYRAQVRRFTTLPITAAEVFAKGEREVVRLEAELADLAERSFGTPDLPPLLRRLREDTSFTFRARGQVVDGSQAAIVRARAAMPRWFGVLPRAEVDIVEYPEFRQRAGAVPSYSPAPDDGSRHAIFYITTWRPEQYPRANLEAIAFHEAIPGHHLQVAIARERKGVHPITRYFGFSGFGEGWALYAEGLADEMGLYSGPVDRMGFLASEQWRAARLVLDAGIHTRGWTREQAVEYLTTHAMISPSFVQGEIDRYISWPGQATAYMLGALEIRDLRRQVEARLGDRFEIRTFHDRVLGNGGITLPMLREEIERWAEWK